MVEDLGEMSLHQKVFSCSHDLFCVVMGCGNLIVAATGNEVLEVHVVFSLVRKSFLCSLQSQIMLSGTCTVVRF